MGNKDLNTLKTHDIPNKNIKKVRASNSPTSPEYVQLCSYKLIIESSTNDFQGMIVNEVLRPVQPNELREGLMLAAFLQLGWSKREHAGHVD